MALDLFTVTGLNISVEWDTTMIFPYHFDTNHHQSDVVVCDEPRILQREKIAVGCLVERGYMSWFITIDMLRYNKLPNVL